MDWRSFFIGIAFLGGGFLLYKIRNWGNMAGDESVYKAINTMERFKSWAIAIMCAIIGIVFIVKSLP